MTAHAPIWQSKRDCDGSCTPPLLRNQSESLMPSCLARRRVLSGRFCLFRESAGPPTIARRRRVNGSVTITGNRPPPHAAVTVGWSMKSRGANYIRRPQSVNWKARFREISAGERRNLPDSSAGPRFDPA